MPIYRGPDGKIIEERTKKVSGDALTRHTPQPANVQQHVDEDRTRKVSEPQQQAPAAAPKPAPGANNDGRTRYVPAAAVASEASSALSDPVVGWLAIVAGPGKGQVLPLGYGANSIGRGTGNRVNVDFGDEQISRSQHTIVTYDPRGRKFYLQPGSGAALTYLNDQPLLAPGEIARGTRLTLGNTTLYFQPLCGADFDWQDLAEKKS
jgi:hypothetical protein